MSFWERFFGKAKANPSSSGPAEPERELSSNSAQPETIKVFDGYGRELYITKEQWRDSILLGNLEKAKNDPDELYNIIVFALNDGFAADVVRYAEILNQIDPIPARSAVLLGVVNLQLNRIDEAESALTNYIKRYGEEGYVLTNLAKVFDKRGDHAKAELTLWRAIELDPNQENAVGWYWMIAKERGGDEAGIAALQRISELPASWRARLWLARTALEHNEVNRALEIYRDVLKLAPVPVPADLLMQMTGDLGNHGQLVEVLKLALPYFNATQHGLEVGNNLIKANLDLGRIDHAHALLEQLYSLKRPDYQQTLSYWDTEIAKARVASANTAPGPTPALEMLQLAGPIWLPSGSVAATHFCATKSPDAVVVSFLGSSIETSGIDEPRSQLPEISGRLSRALPLFLAEQIHLRSEASSFLLQPWIGTKGFAVIGVPWDSKFAIDQANRCEPPADYLVVTHLVDSARPRLVQYRLVRCIDGSTLDQGSVSLDPEQVMPAFANLAEKVLGCLCKQAKVDRVQQSSNYQVPSGMAFNDYQLRLEQLLAVRAAPRDDASDNFLSGTREIILGNVHQCVEQSTNPTTRLVMAETLARLKRISPQAVADHRDRVAQLQREFPLQEPIHGIVQSLLDEALTP